MSEEMKRLNEAELDEAAGGIEPGVPLDPGTPPPLHPRPIMPPPPVSPTPIITYSVTPPETP